MHVAEFRENPGQGGSSAFSTWMREVFCLNNNSALGDLWDQFWAESSDAVLVGDQEMRVIWVNRCAQELFSCQEELTGEKIDGHICADKPLGETIQRLMRESWERRAEHRLVEKAWLKNRPFLFLLETRFLKLENTQAAGLMLTVKDITEHKIFYEETNRRYMQKIVNQVASGLAHEIRNPLTAVRGFIQLLHEQLKKSSKKEYLQVALDELDRANFMIKDFLLFVRPAAPNFSLVHLKQVLEEAVSVVKPDAEAKRLPVPSVSGDVFPLMYLDPEQICRALVNVLKNAVDFSEKGTIRIWVHNDEKMGKVVLSVQDMGPGIPPEIISHIFEPFFTTKEEAPGMGLALTYSIIRNHGGEVHVFNNPDGGTTVTMELLYVSRYPAS
ncbi:two-component system sensor histidine kinase NtrB [Candidatus Formimonas warabiya]|uniref:histidine kinase n=1 Tax=Formimonas warabiya TaxID=1761012 RepID=A0A3G1KNF6_FORW1|nr:ATP-binding protein [Candidatus Formimonas warabiya]ATW24021.1 hypothetical protein DCMF_03735 [Candidatus Formimonas warabiya]